MSPRYDLAVVGGGPIGSYTAYQLAQAGFRVALFEKNEQAGQEAVCAGIIGLEAFQRFHLPRETIVSEIKSIAFYSPKGLCVRYAPEKPFAYLTDRPLFDQKIMDYAREAKVDIYLGREVEKVQVRKDYVELKVNPSFFSPEIKAQVVILATGANYQLHSSLGLSSPSFLSCGAQTKVKVKEVGEVEVHLGNHLPAGSFAWIIPYRHQYSRIGVLVEDKAKENLERLIQEHFSERLLDNHPEIRQRRTTQGFVGKIVSQRALAVGEAAGQVKTTSGGGIFYGLICSQILTQVLKEAWEKKNLDEKGLLNYQKLCRAKIGRELKMGLHIKRIWKRLKDKDIDRFFRVIQKSLGEVIKDPVDFEYHSSSMALGLSLLQTHLPTFLHLRGR